MLAAGQVAAAIAARISGQTDAGTRVVTDRTWPFADTQLPACRVVARDESVSATWQDGLTVEADLDVSAAFVVKATSGIDAAMNALASAALTALFASHVPYALELTGMSRETSNSGESVLGVITIDLRAHYAYRLNAPDTIITST